MLTQEQANAIAEREYPISGDEQISHTVRVINKASRAAYAKCLMDHVNPLIEAGDACRSHLSAWDDGGTELSESCKSWDTALSNLTKK